jgi:hypothetical protein
MEAHPGTAARLSNLAINAHAAKPKLKSEITMPSKVMAFNGIAEKDVMPFMAREIIFGI